MKLLKLMYAHPFISFLIFLYVWTIIHYNFIATHDYPMLSVSPDRIVQCEGTTMAWSENLLITCEIKP